MSESKLTAKQQRFVEEYLVDLNATQAAISAGYSEKTVKERGCRLLINVHVAAAITKAKESRSERTKVDTDWVLTRLHDEADLADLYNGAGHLKSIHDWPKIWRTGLIAGVEVDETTVGGVKMGEVTKVKISDRIKRIELVGKHVEVQAFSKRHEHSIDVEIKSMTDDELDKCIAGFPAIFADHHVPDVGETQAVAFRRSVLSV